MIFLAVAVVLVAVGFGWIYRSTDRLVARSVKRNVLVTTKTGGLFRGVLKSADQRSLVLASASTLDEHGTEVAVDGEVLILRSEVAFVQLL